MIVTADGHVEPVEDLEEVRDLLREFQRAEQELLRRFEELLGLEE